ncbi:MAG TPA: DEAD/DEAH box helicase [Clostridiaceae bacterium]
MEFFNEYNLSEDILKALNTLNIITPTKVQDKVIPLLLKEQDLIVQSQTGSGKTAAFGIPLCQDIQVEEELKALILTPTRELCLQVKDVLINIGRYKRLRTVAIFGKQPVKLQKAELKQRVNMVVGTPGRTLDLIERGILDPSSFKYLIIDEADKMLSMGFIDQMEALLNKLPKDRVSLLFSATLPEKIQELCQKYMKEPISIRIEPDKPLTYIDQECYLCQDNNKYKLLETIIFDKRPTSSIIFCNTKANIENLYAHMKKNFESIGILHGGMLQKDRTNIMEEFKKGSFTFLLATDVASRGIDVEAISHIINYDVPFEVETYVHRIGRTGRAGNFGVAITLVVPYEMKYLTQIETYIGFEIPKTLPPMSVDFDAGKKFYKENISIKHPLKESLFNKEITKLYINAGKKKKLRTVDIVGALTSLEGISPENIGIINIYDNYSNVDILDGKGDYVIKALQTNLIKGKLLRVEKAKD